MHTGGVAEAKPLLVAGQSSTTKAGIFKGQPMQCEFAPTPPSYNFDSLQTAFTLD